MSLRDILEQRLYDMGVKEKLKIKKIGYGTKNFTKGPAMSREKAIQSIEAGMDVVNEISGINILGLGDMGIGNTTPSSAIIAYLSGQPIRNFTGRGTGIDDETFNRKVRVISTAGALIATELAPIAKEYIIGSHNSQEIGHRVMLERMGLVPLFDLGLRLGEGTGAALGISLVEVSIKILTQMATFANAVVSGKIRK